MNRPRASGRADFAIGAGRGRLPVSILISFAVFLAISLFAWVTTAIAQHPNTEGAAPPPPAGNGVLTVRVIHANEGTEPREFAGIEILLYALSSDGTPGLIRGETDAEGVHRFSGISTDPGIVYLVGARFEGIPFGERVTFASGETEARVDIEVMSPSDQTDGVTVEELRLRVDWMGDRIVVREILQIENASNNVIRLPPTAGSPSIVSRPLDPAAADFFSGPDGSDNGVAFENGSVEFRGPLYRGAQRIEYGYSLPLETDRKRISIPIELAQPTSRIVIIAGTTGLQVEAAGLIRSSAVKSDGGQALEAWARSGLAAGEVFEVALTLPESRLGSQHLILPRSNVWLELDDTRMTAAVDIEIEVTPGAPVAGTREEPLLRISIPKGAILQGVAPESESLGLIPIEMGGFDVVGPIAAGTNTLGYSYWMPAGREGVDLEMSFPAEVQTLNVLIADTGLALDSSRLHRRRPFASGTRNYLHREAFNVGPGEAVDLELVPLRATGLSGDVSRALAFAALLAGAFFLFGPLRTAARREVDDASPNALIQARRESIYTAIRDLDHDFETTKVDEADYREMRDRLRTEAIELLRAEEAATAARTEASEHVGPAAIQPPTGEEISGAGTGAFCPNCGGNVRATWRFCSHCGGSLVPPEEAKG